MKVFATAVVGTSALRSEKVTFEVDTLNQRNTEVTQTTPLLQDFNNAEVDQSAQRIAQVQQQDLNLFVVSYNLGGINSKDVEKLANIATHLVNMSDNEPAKVFAFQEVMELKTNAVWEWVYLNKKGKALELALQNALNAKHNCVNCYQKVESTSMWAQRTVVFAKTDAIVEARALNPWKPALSTGNKGAVAMHITMKNAQKTASALVLNVHLPSEDGKEADNKRAIMMDKIVKFYSAYKSGKKTENFFADAQGKKRNVIATGDFNARLNLNKKNVDQANFVKTQMSNAEKLINDPSLAHIADFSDKLFNGADNFFKAMTSQNLHVTHKGGCLNLKTVHTNLNFGFVEKPKTFMPTYKVQHNLQKVQKAMTNYHQTNVNGVQLNYFDVKNGKKCMPAWTDRVFLHGDNKTADDILSYKSDPTLTESDHLPVSAVIKL